MKTMSPLHRTACIAALSVCAAAPALAKDSGFFLGLDIGQAKYETEEVTETGLFPTSTGARTDDKDQAFSLAFGYRINRYLGAELSFRDFGKASLVEQGFGTDTRTTVTVAQQQTRPTAGLLEIDQQSEGFALSVLGSLPLQNFELYGKLGLFYAETQVDVRLTSISTNAATTSCTTANAACTWAFPGAGRGTASTKSTGALFAVGAGYTFAEEFHFKLEWMRAPGLGDEDELGLEEFDVDVISAGFQYRF
jgi:hypothetical protein